MNKEIKEYIDYCLNCKKEPCKVNGCPLSNEIPEIIKLAKEGKIKEAYNILNTTTALGSICGRICPHKKQCEGSCVRLVKGESVQIGKIESYISDFAIENVYYKDLKCTNKLEGKKVAIIGSGPASLTASAFLARSGAKVTIYEKYSELGRNINTWHTRI